MQTVSNVSLPQDTLLNLYFSGMPGCVVKGVVSNPLFQIFLDPALCPLLGEDGLKRVGGRIDNSEQS